MMKIQIPRSKTDQFKQGSEVLIARKRTDTCPVTILEQYFLRVEQDTTGGLSNAAMVRDWVL